MCIMCVHELWCYIHEIEPISDCEKHYKNLCNTFHTKLAIAIVLHNCDFKHALFLIVFVGKPIILYMWEWSRANMEKKDKFAGIGMHTNKISVLQSANSSIETDHFRILCFNFEMMWHNQSNCMQNPNSRQYQISVFIICKLLLMLLLDFQKKLVWHMLFYE